MMSDVLTEMCVLGGCAARTRQSVGNGLSQAMIGWHVWSRNGWNGEKEDMNSDQKTRS